MTLFRVVVAFILLVAEGNSPPQAQGTTGVRIVAVCPDAQPCPVEGSLTLRSVANQSQQERVSVTRGTAHLADGLDGDWYVELDASGFWMPRQTLSRPATGVHSIHVWRTTLLRGNFALERSEDKLPKTFQVLVESPPGTTGATIARTEIDCPVTEDGAWNCVIPATALDLVLRARTFTPHYRWDVKLMPAAAMNLGTLALRREASVVAWLDGATTKTLKEPARARLVRMVTAPSSELGDRLSQPTAEAWFNSRGMVQLAPVPPGTYTLEVIAPGFAPSRLNGIEVYDRSESTLTRAIKLGPPVTLLLSLAPSRDPNGLAWGVEVFLADEFSTRSSRVGHGPADQAGLFELPDQAPGRYRVTVRDARNNVYAKRELIITNEADAQHAIELSLGRFGGTVTLAGTPVGANLLFGGSSGTQKVSAVADAKGVFNVTLPHTGKWTVDVEAKSEGILAAVEVSIEKDQDDIRIRLPDTEVSGWVTGPDGARASGAVVNLRTATGVVSRRVEPDGSFRFRGITPGVATIFANDLRTRERSRIMDVLVADGARAANVQVVLEHLRTIRGVIASEGRPIVGALVTGYGLSEGRGKQEKSVSGLDGGFMLSFPVSASEIILVIAAAGRTLQAYSVPVNEAALRLELAPAGGILRLDIPPGAKGPHLTYNGVVIPFNELLQWARAQGRIPKSPGAFEVPNVAPGLYRFCASRREGGQTCLDGTLARDSVLELILR